MNCSEAITHLDEVRHGDLPLSLAVSVARHVKGCVSCQHRIEEDAALARLLRDRSDEIATDLPPGFSASVLEALPSIGAQAASWNRTRLFEVFAFGLVGMAMVAAAVILPIHYSQKSAIEAAALAAENEAQIHSLEVSSADTHPLVFKTDDGRTVIWMLSDSEFNEAETPASPAAAQGNSPQK